jgi:phospholipid/cholesterol/gamma-HCH transport system permease protein
MTTISQPAAMQDAEVRPRINPLRWMLAGIGRRTLGVLRPAVEFSALATAVIWQACRPVNWRRTLLEEFVRQCGSVGIGALSFILVSGVLIGLALVFQALYWLNAFGQSASVGPIIVLTLVREIAPLLVALILIGRSGSVNMVEFGHMRVSGQLHALDAQGVDPFLFLVVPRCLATALCAFCLTIVFILAALATGFVTGNLVNPEGTYLADFMNNVLAAMGFGEYLIVVLKPSIAGLLIAVITSHAGLSPRGSFGRLADVLPAGFVKSVLAIFLVFGVLNLMF